MTRKAPVEAYQGNAPYLFVSYSHRDTDAVYAELRRLAERGINVWYDEGISPGSRWSDELAERITNCSLFLYFVTPQSVESQNCQDEANFVLEAGRPFLAVHLEETELPPGLNLRMGSRQAILKYKLPFARYEEKLEAAIRAHVLALKASQAGLAQGFSLGDFRVELLAGTLRAEDSEPIHLEPKVMDVLSVLAERPGKIVTREELLEAVWPGQVAADELLTRAISELRRAFDDDRGDPTYIVTVPKRGYRLIAEVRLLERDPPRHSVLAMRHPKPIHRVRWMYSVIALTLMIAAVFLIYSPSMISPESDSVSDVRYATGRARPLTSMEGLEREPALSPDGNYVAFVSETPGGGIESPGGGDRSDLFVVPVNGSTPIPLSVSATEDAAPAWSHDSTQVAFARFIDHDSDMQIVTKPVLGGAEKIVTTAWDVVGIDWSPDGTQLAYVGRDNDGDEFHVFLVSLNNGEKRPFTSSPERIATAPPAFSPDGQSLAYIRYQTYFGNVCIRDITDGGVDCITPEGEEWLVFDFDWTSDSQAIVAVVGWLSGGRTALRVPIGGGRPVPLPFEDSVKFVTIARDGGPLVYSTEYQDSNLWRVPGPTATKFSDPQKLNSMSTWDDFQPTYSPDGSQVAFISARSGNWELWISEADGSSPRQLTRMGHVLHPKWSPMGARIIFSSAGYREGISDERDWTIRPQISQIYTIEVSGGFPQPVVDGTLEAMRPGWSVDGRWFYYMGGRHTKCGTQLYRRNVETGEELMLVDCVEAFVEGNDGRVYFTKQHDDGIQSKPATGGESRIELSDGDSGCPFEREGWTLWRTNLIYIDCTDLKIKLLDLESRESRVLADAYTRETLSEGIDVSPDGRWLTYSRRDRVGSDLMLVEDFQ